MGDIDAALAALDALKAGESFSYTEIAKQYGVQRSTLSRRHRGITQPGEVGNQKNRNLNATQESKLLKYINKLCERGLPPTLEIIRNFRLEIA